MMELTLTTLFQFTIILIGNYLVTRLTITMAMKLASEIAVALIKQAKEEIKKAPIKEPREKDTLI